MKSKRLLAATAVTTMLATSVVPTSILANTKAEKEENTNKNTDALHDQVIEETVHRDEAKEAVNAAKNAVDEKLPLLEDAKREADDKKAALDALNGKLQQDLETEMAKQQNLINETSAQLEHLNENKAELNKQLTMNQDALDQAQEILKEKQTALKAAEEAAEEATEEKTMQAHEAVKTAKQAVGVAEREYEEALLQRDEVMKQLKEMEEESATKEKEIETATLQLTAAKEAQGKARTDLEDAQTNYDRLHAADAVTNLTSELETAAKEYESATKMVAEQEKVVAEAQAAYQTAKTELDTKRASLVTAEEKANDKKKNLDTLSDELAKTMKAKEEAEQAIERSNREREQLKKEAADARKAFDQAISNINIRQLDVARAKATFNQLDRKVKKAEETAQKAQDMRSFLQFVKHTDSAKFLDALLELKQSSGGKWKDSIHLENNGMTLAEMEKALTHIEESNAIRRNLKLPEFKVSSMLLLTSWFNSHYAKYDHFDHCKEVKIENKNAAENLTTATTDMFKGWYDKEKELFDGYVKEGKYPGLETMDAYEVSTKYSSIYPSIGHYLNLVRPSHLVTGFATTENVSSQTFWQGEKLKDTMTVSEYRAKIEDYKKAMAKAGTSENLKKQREAAKARYDQLAKEIETFRQQYDANKAVFEVKNAALQKNLETYHTSSKTISNAEQQIAVLKTRVKDAKTEWTDAQNNKERLHGEVRAKTLKIDSVYKTWYDANELLENKEAAKAAHLAAKEQAATKLKDIETAKKESQRILDAAKQMKAEKDEQLSAAITALEAKNEEKAKLDAQIEAKNTDISTKEAKVSEKATIVENKEKDLDDAYAVIEAYNEVLDTLSKSEEALHLHKNRIQLLKENIADIEKKIRLQAPSIQDLENDLLKKQERKDLLHRLNQEFENIKAGMSGLLLHSDDAFVNAFQANYPKLWIAINEYEQAQKAFAAFEQDAASDQEAYAAAEKAYLDADKKLNALLERMNQELNSEVQKENQEEIKKDSSNVQTATANDSTLWAISFGSAAGAWAVIERKRKAAK